MRRLTSFVLPLFFFFSSRRRHTRSKRDWSSDVCSSDLLRAQARSFLEKSYPLARLAEIATSEDGWDRASWAELARLGWTGASIPEAQGGAGLSFVEEAIVFEELGRALYAGPFFSTVALA